MGQKLLRSINRRTLRKLKNWLDFQKDKKNFVKLLASDHAQNKLPWRLGDDYPIMNEKKATNGNAGGHYFHQDLLVAQQIFLKKPKRHLDVASRMEGFVTHVASYRKIEVMDIRPQTRPIPNVIFIKRDLMLPIKPQEKEKFDSISCLHALEHFGLGRYGDDIDPWGHKKGMANMVALLKKKGILYFSTPFGERRIMYNAHRVFDMNYLLTWFAEVNLKVIEFSYIDDHDNLHINQPLKKTLIDKNYGVKNYGCAIFQLQKAASSI